VGIGGRAPLYFEPRTKDEIAELISVLKEKSIPFRILGGGSNVLVPDRDLEEVVISTQGISYLIAPEDEDLKRRVDAGVSLARFVSACRKFALKGAESLAGIPGTVGGAAVMNAGGVHGDIGSLIRSATVINKAGEIEERTLNPDEFSYRSSPFEEGEVVLDLLMQLERGNEKAIWEKTTAILKKKKEQQPLLSKSCGCVFQNPPNDSAGRLLDKVGMKGQKNGEAMVSDLHANFIINIKKCTFEDYLALAEEGRKRVFESFDIDLHMEIKTWNA